VALGAGQLQRYRLDKIPQSFDLGAVQLIVAQHRREKHEREPPAIGHLLS
jgi:hypothetical protein